MFKPRSIEGQIDWLDETNSKIYTISAHNDAVEKSKYLPRLKDVKLARNIDWVNTPSFVIFHDGASCDYLVLVWWANDNELFTSVSVKSEGVWAEDPNKYSFCLYDLEIMWAERNIYVQTMDCEFPSLKLYQISR
ncbi:hypothetical protein FE810_06595 [Thalassotalea litorea]|uniref:Isochorismatase n=1 Tax=Thalassotalea litorea TaxID=2020715 RepID=A0A5R9ILE8_9GAMM|nr:hypothetical protein [Thalassotalea litorea]TLU66354.1 hypothetical protein FE810_06595 [Thalassotalea litorea]